MIKETKVCDFCKDSESINGTVSTYQLAVGTYTVSAEEPNPEIEYKDVEMCLRCVGYFIQETIPLLRPKDYEKVIFSLPASATKLTFERFKDDKHIGYPQRNT